MENESAGAESHLVNAERSLIARIENSHLREAEKKLLASAARATMDSFRAFRQDQCQFAWATAAGGNSAEDKRLACAAYLTDLQTSTWNAYVPEDEVGAGK